MEQIPEKKQENKIDWSKFDAECRDKDIAMTYMGISEIDVKFMNTRKRLKRYRRFLQRKEKRLKAA